MLWNATIGKLIDICVKIGKPKGMNKDLEWTYLTLNEKREV